MIFRRSLVRELTATAIGLFVVLLAILFTNLVLRLLARAAGGAVAPEGILALLGFNALFYLNILLSVTLFLTVLLTLSRWYRDSEMIVWFTSGQSARRRASSRSCWFAAPFLVAIVVLSLFLSPWAEQRKLEFERQLESRDELALVTPGLFREFRRANLVVFVESINTFDGTIRNIFLHSVDDGQGRRPRSRASGTLQEMPQRRPLHRARRTAAATRASPGTAEFRDRRVRQARAAHRAGRSSRALPTSTKAIPTPTLLRARRRRRARRAVLARSRCRSRRWC